jgi:SAM-dependent methyltransferase
MPNDVVAKPPADPSTDVGVERPLEAAPSTQVAPDDARASGPHDEDSVSPQTPTTGLSRTRTRVAFKIPDDAVPLPPLGSLEHEANLSEGAPLPLLGMRIIPLGDEPLAMPPTVPPKVETVAEPPRPAGSNANAASSLPPPRDSRSVAKSGDRASSLPPPRPQAPSNLGVSASSSTAPWPSASAPAPAESITPAPPSSRGKSPNHLPITGKVSGAALLGDLVPAPTPTPPPARAGSSPFLADPALETPVTTHPPSAYLTPPRPRMSSRPWVEGRPAGEANDPRAPTARDANEARPAAARDTGERPAAPRDANEARPAASRDASQARPAAARGDGLERQGPRQQLPSFPIEDEDTDKNSDALTAPPISTTPPPPSEIPDLEVEVSLDDPVSVARPSVGAPLPPVGAEPSLVDAIDALLARPTLPDPPAAHDRPSSRERQSPTDRPGPTDRPTSPDHLMAADRPTLPDRPALLDRPTPPDRPTPLERPSPSDHPTPPDRPTLPDRPALEAQSEPIPESIELTEGPESESAGAETSKPFGDGAAPLAYGGGAGEAVAYGDGPDSLRYADGDGADGLTAYNEPESVDAVDDDLGATQEVTAFDLGMDDAEEADEDELEEVDEAEVQSDPRGGRGAAAPAPYTSSVRLARPERGGATPPQPPAKAAREEAIDRSKRRTRPWWEELFDDDFLRATPRPTDSQVVAEASFIEARLGLAKGALILDLACGHGRHAIELTRRGYQVVGFDLSLAMLAHAADEAEAARQKVNFLHGDMREMPFEDKFDGVYCWGTSFGFFEEEKNLALMQRVYRALRPGGVFLIETLNRDYVSARQPSLVWYEGDGCLCMDEAQMDFITSRLKVKRTIMLDDGRTREVDYSMRLYGLHELGKLMHEAGFRVIEVSGRLATPGIFFGADSPQCIVLAERD